MAVVRTVALCDSDTESLCITENSKRPDRERERERLPGTQLVFRCAAGWLRLSSVESTDNKGFFYIADSYRQHSLSGARNSECLVASGGRLGVGAHVLFDVPFSYFVQLSRFAAQPGAGMEQPGNTVCL